MTTGKTRTNQANDANGIQLFGIRKLGDCDFSPTWTFAYDASEDELTFTATAGSTATGLRAWKYTVKDEDGNEAVAAMNVASPAAVVVDTATLNPLQKWTVHFFAETRNAGLSCISEWNLLLPSGFGLADASGSGQLV